MTVVVSGICAQGKIELLETPVGIRDGKVRVIVIEENEAKTHTRPLQFGKYSSGTLSTEIDFSIAHWHEKKRMGKQRWRVISWLTPTR